MERRGQAHRPEGVTRVQSRGQARRLGGRARGGSGIPDPAALPLREWILELPPERVHREVLERLRARPLLVEEAWRRRVLDLQDRRQLPPGEIRLEISLACLARLTITAPMGGASRVLFPLLPLSAPRAVAGAVPPVFRDATTAVRALVIATFEERVVSAAWDPLADDAELLQQYEILRAYLEDLAAGEPLEDWLHRTTATPGEILRVGEATYRPSPRLRGLVDGRTMPSSLAWALLADRGATNSRYIKGRLRQARRERELRRAWSRYGTWVAGHEAEAADLRACFGPYPVTLPKPELA